MKQEIKIPTDLGGRVSRSSPSSGNKPATASFLIALSLLLTLSVAACGGGSSDDGGGSGSATPTASATPADGALFLDSQAIIISFGQSMNRTSLILGGDLAAEDDGGNWSTTTSTDDTLTIGPATAWTAGFPKTLTVDAQDTAGNAIAPLSLGFHIVEGFIHVRTDGNDGNSGSAGSPKLTIQAGISQAAIDFTVAAVKVAGGTYAFDSCVGGIGGSSIAMMVGISIYGGYSPTDWSARDTVANATAIVDTNTGCGAFTNPNRPVHALSGAITTATVIDGFTITGNGGSDTAAIFISAATPTISNNILAGGGGSSASYGIYIDASSPAITGNTIDSGNGGIASYGIFTIAAASITIAGNTITAGGGSNASYGIYIQNTGPSSTISNNIIDGGSGANSLGIYCFASSSPTITGNTITGGGGGLTTTSYGISAFTNSSPIIRGNTIAGGSGSSLTYGIKTQSTSAPEITGNTIFGGGGGGPATNSYGIFNFSASAPAIRNNTIDGGTGTINSFGIRNESASQPTIENNIVFATGSAASSNYCISEGDGTSDPTSVRNNDLFACGTARYQDSPADGGGDLTTILAMEADLAAEGILTGGNTGDNPQLANQAGGDWHPTASSPTTVTQGGLDGVTEGWPLTGDRDGVTRTAPWSMGAYEYD